MVVNEGRKPVHCRIISVNNLVKKNHVWQTKNHILLNLRLLIERNSTTILCTTKNSKTQNKAKKNPTILNE
jgi:hypothetical protein